MIEAIGVAQFMNSLDQDSLLKKAGIFWFPVITFPQTNQSDDRSLTGGLSKNKI